MRLILLGPPGAGKGTQAVRLAERFDVPHVATGDLLRFAVAWETPIGMRAKSYMDAGDLVPDEIVLELLRTRLSQADASVGFLMDGYPRNTAQADSLSAILDEIGQHLDAVVSMEVDDEIIVERLSSRWSCPTCGRTFKLNDGMPTHCNLDATRLFQRDDDKPEVIRKRLGIFHAQTAAVVAYYEKLGIVQHVNGVGGMDEVEARIAKTIES